MNLSLKALKKTTQNIRTSRHALHMLRLTVVTSALAAVSVSAQAPLDVRVALIIGNSAYPGNMALVNPANDAKDMADVLKRLGFNVVELRDGNRVQMAAAIAKVSDSLKGKQGLGMLYYAGHGLQLDWRNYMVPVDANLKTAADVAAQTIDLNSVIDVFKAAGNRMNIVVLDACRDNPFGSSTSSAKGLAQLDAPPSTFLAYATAPGNVAEDGDEKSGNGLYTQYLLQELKRPIAKIEDVFKRVRLNVRKQSNGRQIPWESTSLEDDFFFNDGAKYTIKPEELERMAAEVRQREQKRLAQEAEVLARAQQLALAKERERQQAEARELDQQRQAAEARAKEAERLSAAAKAIEQEKLAAEARARDQQRQALESQARERERLLALEQVKERERLMAEAKAREQERLAELARLQETQRVAALAKAQDQRMSKEQARDLAFKEEKAAWDQIKTSSNPEDFYSFLQRFPSGGDLAEAAQYRLDQLAKPKITTALGKGQDASFAYSGPRYKVGDVYEAQLSDLLTNVPGAKVTARVTRSDGEVVELNNGRTVTTALSALVKTGLGTFDPPLGGLPVELQVGKKWSGRSTQTTTSGQKLELTSESKITAIQTITVPAGTFQTYVIETTLYGGSFRVNVKLWIDPRYGYPIKREELARSGSNITRSDRSELVSIKANRS